MSYYKNYDFTSPEPIFSLIRDELRSYFSTGVVDDVLFPTYVDKCLSRLGRSTYKIEPTVLHIENFTAQLPSDFLAVREAWACYLIAPEKLVKAPGAVYEQVTTMVSQVPLPTICDTCSGLPDVITATYKSNNYASYNYRKSHLLKPGNISKHGDCNFECKNHGASVHDSFDVRNDKFFTNFQEGDVYVLYYKEVLDENENQMIPDNFRIKEYIEAYIKSKVFEQLSNTVVDETYNQIMQKVQLYQQKADEAFVLATTEDKKQDIFDKQRSWIRTRNKNNRYKIKNGSRRIHY